MRTFVITFQDTRFDDMPLTREERIAMLREMIQRGTLDLSDGFVAGLTISDGQQRELTTASRRS